MELWETIALKGIPFIKRLPRPASELIAVLAKYGYHFAGSDFTLYMHAVHESQRLPAIKEILENEHLDLAVEQSLWTEFDESDYDESPLSLITFSDVSIQDVRRSERCRVCEKPFIRLDDSLRVSRVPSSKAIVCVNGAFTVARKDMKDAIEQHLTGTRFLPFDDKGRYFYLLAEHSLGQAIFRDDVCKGYTGKSCPECGFPIFEVYFGPLLFCKENWSGEDVIAENFHQSILFSAKAYELLKSFDSEVVRNAPVFLV